VIRIQWNGQLTADEVNGMREYTRALRHELGGDEPIYTIVTIGEGVEIKRNARKAIMALSRERAWAATAIVGARYEVKVLVELTINAVRLLVDGAAASKFVDTEEQALAWLDEQGAAS
jgi:hypothetical protein